MNQHEIRRPAACEQDRENRNGQRSALATVEKRARLWGSGGEVTRGGPRGGVPGGRLDAIFNFDKKLI